MAKKRRRHSDFEIEVFSVGRPSAYQTSKGKMDKLYKKFKASTLTIENRLRKLGYSEEYIGKTIVKPNKKQFKELYMSLKQINAKEGYRMNVLKETIDALYAGFTAKQYRAFRTSQARIKYELQESGFDTPEERKAAGYKSISSFEFRFGDKGKKFLDDEYKKLKLEGLSPKEAKRFISQQYFSSK